jgi:hypothetical protein
MLGDVAAVIAVFVAAFFDTERRPQPLPGNYDVAALQLMADEHVAFSVDAVPSQCRDRSF